MPQIDLSPAPWFRVPTTLRFVPLLMAGTLVLGSPNEAAAGANPNFRIMLHAKASSFEPCSGFLPLNCVDHPPMVNVPQASPLAIFALFYRVEQVSGIQTAFEWPGWTLTFGLWDCLLGQICKLVPGTPPNNQVIDCNFNCVTSPEIVPFGRFFIVPAGNPGCISQVIPDRPNGIHVRDCSGGIDTIEDPNSLRLGRVCIGSGGNTTCIDIIPVESATWGKIKATYQ